MNNLKKGTLVFVHTQSYPPWPAEIQRKYDNGLYKVNFIGEKSYTKIELDKVDLFTEQRAKQIHSQLQDKKLSKAIFVALKQFQNRRKRGQIDQQLSDLLKKQHHALDLSMYKHMAKTQYNKSYPIQFSKYSSQGSTEQNLQEIGNILDRVYDYTVLPVNEKLPQYLQPHVYSERLGKVEHDIARLRQLFVKEEDNYRPTVGQKELSEKETSSKGSQTLLQTSSLKKPLPPSPQPTTLPKSQFMQKLIDLKIIQRLIMTIKAYESFREQNQKQLQEIINFLKEKFNVFYDKFREEYNRKKLPSQKDRIMLEKFQSFQAYL